jgi:photosystem II stability/assembly factor-like uncharacterized protein
MRNIFKSTTAIALVVAFTIGGLDQTAFAQSKLSNEDVKKAVSAMKMRGIGPAVMGGRIAHVEVDPNTSSTWFVAAGSGGVWKTTNAGITFTPVFEGEKSYSIGTLAIDAQNSDVVWVGTGENVSGRHVGWGDGIYKSTNGGKTWQQMGLEKSEHIGRILIDPRDSNTVYVAAEGPLWNGGGDRGVYKTTDGGKTWDAILTVDENTGVTDIEFKPGNPDHIYAATYQRRRHTSGFMSGGPGSGIHVSSDAGTTWAEVTLGLPKGDMGKIGLAVTPADPTLVYATIEANDKDKGFYRSINSGESFEKRNSYISGGTGPHYYMEIEASPTDANTVYQMDVFMRVTRDGGKTFQMAEDGWTKHSDNHALWIDPKNSNHLIVGSDAGLYESFDDGKQWRHFGNMPISQFYKVAMDKTEPFYNILVGAQDLGTLRGPSRTMNIDGVRNQDWVAPTGADGYGVAFDPDDDNIQYMEFQQGVMFRVDGRTNEITSIQPKGSVGDEPERWNWDTPIVTSSHESGRLYTGSQRLWRSDDRGNSWTAISGDLTTNTNRYTLEYQGRVWSVDALHDNGAMSKYSTLTAVSESQLNESLLYAGSDDGEINYTNDGGENWTKAGKLPGVPAGSFVNDLDASVHDEDNVFAVADAHKIGVYKPFVFKSTNKGRTWRSIAGDLPEDLIIWAIQQDHENADLLFLGTESGVYASINAGKNWNKMGGTPTIAFRDIKIHKRDNDLVGATFGRGVYIMDDYSALRSIASDGDKAGVMPVRDAWWYLPNTPMQAKGQVTFGSSAFRTENPAFGATINLYMTDMPRSEKAERLKDEAALRKAEKDATFPGFDKLHDEANAIAPKLFVEIRDLADNAVRIIPVKGKNGLQRVAWDLRHPAPQPIDLRVPGFKPPWAGDPKGPLVSPGTYKALLILKTDGKITPLGEVQSFEVKPVKNAANPSDYVANAAYWKDVSDAQKQMGFISEKLSRAQNLLRHMKVAVVNAPNAEASLVTRLDTFGVSLNALQTALYGDRVRGRLNEPSASSIGSYLWGSTSRDSREGPTATQRTSFNRAKSGLAGASSAIAGLIGELALLEAALEKAGAPSWR